MRVAINGAGVAGPALAYWLRRTQHDVLLIEQSPELRRGGYVIDFWGIGYDIAEKMGLIPEIRRLGYQVMEVRFVNRWGKPAGGFTTVGFDRATGHRFTSVRRSDLAATIYHALDDGVESLFGDSIASVEEDGKAVRIGFDHAGPRVVDLVIGADGLHSRIRALGFGPPTGFEVPLGYYVAAFEIDGYRPRDELVYLSYGVAGRQISRFSMREDKTLVLFMFGDEFLPARGSVAGEDCCALLREIFGDLSWECPRILAACEQATSRYFDRVSQVRMASWSKGRTALIGDAAACVSLLGGEGTGLAIVEAYVLAGELHRCHADYAAAFRNYQDRLMPFLERKQEMASRFASSFMPRTASGVVLRNLATWVLRIPFIADRFFRREFRDDFPVPDYGI